MKNIFEIDNFNLIQDNENYYFFRALNKADNKDLEEGIILDDNGQIIRIRTDRERYVENPENNIPKYTKEDKISLEQVHDHIKMHYRKDTNCISLSTDANAIIDYGRGSYNDKYIMVKVPKKEIGQNVKFAGKYLLEEIEKEVNKHIDVLNPNEELDAEILTKIGQIENAKSIAEIREIVKTTYKGQIDTSRSGMKQGILYRKPQVRLSSYQALSDAQNLEKNKVVGKLTLLENKKGLNRIIPLASNSKLLETVGNSFSSMELVHYGDIPGEVVTEVPSKIMDMFSLIQQIKDDNIPNIDDIKNELVKYINNGMKFTLPEDSIFNREDKVKDNITIEEMYNLTNGRVEYGNANSIIKNVFYLAKSQARARELSNILNQITGNNPKYAQIIKYIAENGFEIEPEAITRHSNIGYKISESVNLNLKKNEESLIEDIKHLSTEELLDVMEKGGLSDIKDIITNNFSKIERDEQISKEEYYASAIIDLYDWKKIGIEEFTVEQRNDLLQKLLEKGSMNIYRKLQEAGIPEKEIPSYTFNIASKDHLNDILKQENFIELLKQNEEELKQELSVPQIESFLEYYAVDGTEIVLRDYQRNAVIKTDEIFENNKFASVVLPTGAGKSFVALTELMEHKDEKLLYLAPSYEILEQMKDNIIKYLHGLKGTLDKDSNESIIAEVFPNIKFETYQGLTAKKGKEVIKQEYGFIVLDELHRTGAKEWEKKLDELLNNQEENVKVLGITATPTRDMDDRNMAKEIALKLGYNKEQIDQNQHIAMDMDLVEAIKLGLVVNPKIISCEYSLNQDGSMDDLLTKINKIEDPETKKELLSKYEKLRRNLDKAQGIPEILQSNIKPGGKYIVFIPVTEKGEALEDEDGNVIGKKTGEDKIKEYQEKIKEYLKDSGLNSRFYSMLGAYTDKKNEEQLKSFESSKTEDIKFMLVMNKANEGLHVKGIDGIIWFRALDENSKILYLQQLGRAIYSEDPNNPTPEDKRPIVFDFANNTLNVDIDKDIKNNNRSDDLQLLSTIVDWVKLHNGLPDIKSTNKIEQRYAATLYRIQNKYLKYLNGFDTYEDMDKEKKIKIQAIIDKGIEIDLWDIEFPPKPVDIIDKIINVDAFEIRGVLRDFVEFENEVDGIQYISQSLKNALEIENWCKERYGKNPIWDRKLPSKREKDEEEKRLGIALVNIRTKLKGYEGKSIEEIKNNEDRKILKIVRQLDEEYGLSVSLKNTLEIENWCKEKYGENPIWDRKLPSTMAKDEEEKRLGIALSGIRTKLKGYEGKSIEEIKNNEDRKILEIVRQLDEEYGLGDSLKNALEIENWCKEKYGKNPIWDRKLPSTMAKDEEEKRLGLALKAIRAKLKGYEGKSIEEIKNNEDRKILEIVRQLDEEYGLGDSLKNALEIENWCKERYGENPIWDRKLPSKREKDEEEKRLGIALKAIRAKLKGYEGKSIEEIKNNEDRKILEIVRQLDEEYGLGVSLKNTLEIENWCKEKYGKNPIWDRKLPSAMAKDEEEKRLGSALNSIRIKLKEYEGKSIEEIKNNEDRKILEIVMRLDKEYRLGDLLKNALEIENWCKERYGKNPIWNRKLPSTMAKDEEEKRLGIALKTIRAKLKGYEGKSIEEIKNNEDRKILEIVRQLDEEYGLSGSLKNALEIENWCKERYGENPIWKRKLPSPKAKDEEAKRLGIVLGNIRQKLKGYEGKSIEEIKNNEDRKILEIVRQLDEEYGLGVSLKNTLEIENWCKEKYGKNPIWDRKLPSRTAKDEEEKRLGSALNSIRIKLKGYEGKSIEEIENEEDRRMMEIINRLDREYNYRKIKAQDIGQAGFSVGIGDIEKSDEAQRVLENLVEKTKEGGIRKDE